jgi:hypothetical protein
MTVSVEIDVNLVQGRSWNKAAWEVNLLPECSDFFGTRHAEIYVRGRFGKTFGVKNRDNVAKNVSQDVF